MNTCKVLTDKVHDRGLLCSGSRKSSETSLVTPVMGIEHSSLKNGMQSSNPGFDPSEKVLNKETFDN
jgi:hypothetical protein